MFGGLRITGFPPSPILKLKVCQSFLTIVCCVMHRLIVFNIVSYYAQRPYGDGGNLHHQPSRLCKSFWNLFLLYPLKRKKFFKELFTWQFGRSGIGAIVSYTLLPLAFMKIFSLRCRLYLCFGYRTGAAKSL